MEAANAARINEIMIIGIAEIQFNNNIENKIKIRQKKYKFLLVKKAMPPSKSGIGRIFENAIAAFISTSLLKIGENSVSALKIIANKMKQTGEANAIFAVSKSVNSLNFFPNLFLYDGCMFVLPMPPNGN